MPKRPLFWSPIRWPCPACRTTFSLYCSEHRWRDKLGWLARRRFDCPVCRWPLFPELPNRWTVHAIGWPDGEPENVAMFAHPTNIKNFEKPL